MCVNKKTCSQLKLSKAYKQKISMKILYDYQAFYLQKFGGISNCFVKLIENLPAGIEYNLAIQECDNVHLKESKLHVNFSPCKLNEDAFISKKKFKGRDFLYRCFTDIFPTKTSLGLNRQCSIEAINRGDYDVFHPTFLSPYFLKYLNDKPFVLTVHDMIPELYSKDNGSQMKEKPRLCRLAAHIIAVSERTKQDLVELLHVPKEKITVIYHGAPEITFSLSNKPIIDGKYILFVGHRGKYKSFFPMMRFLKPFLLRHTDVKVVCTGQNLSKEELSTLQAMGLNDKVIHLCASDVEMMNLYTNALCFVFPSQYEGFGIPILEAYKAHCPVLLNKASCFPEIAGDAAVYFYLNDSSSNLEQVLEQFSQISYIDRQDLIDRQLKRLSLFSWKRSAEQLAEVYLSVYNKF